MQQITLSGNKICWNNFCLGEILPNKSTFSLIPRSKRNIFHLFGGGLGLNTQALQLLDKLKIQFIEGTLNGRPFKVKVDKWIKKGIRSPYTSDKVDPQIILKLEDIFSDEKENDNQLSFQLMEA